MRLKGFGVKADLTSMQLSLVAQGHLVTPAWDIWSGTSVSLQSWNREYTVASATGRHGILLPYRLTTVASASVWLQKGVTQHQVGVRRPNVTSLHVRHHVTVRDGQKERIWWWPGRVSSSPSLGIWKPDGLFQTEWPLWSSGPRGMQIGAQAAVNSKKRQVLTFIPSWWCWSYKLH